MPCRIGISTNPERRLSEWNRKYYGINNFKILKNCKTKREAQNWEDKYAQQYGCKAHSGGSEAIGPWYVYYFEYSRKK